jgi:hypothetical protein
MQENLSDVFSDPSIDTPARLFPWLFRHAPGWRFIGGGNGSCGKQRYKQCYDKDRVVFLF